MDRIFAELLPLAKGGKLKRAAAPLLRAPNSGLPHVGKEEKPSQC
jgi:hypothetical protein